MGFKDAGKPHYLGHRERLRRRFRDAGADAVPDYELLELILFRAAPRRDTKPLAKALLARFGTFAEALNAPEELLREVPGIGEAAITELKLVRAAAVRLMRGEVLERPVLSSWSQVLDYCRASMGFETKEQFRMLSFMLTFSFGFKFLRLTSPTRPPHVLHDLFSVRLARRRRATREVCSRVPRLYRALVCRFLCPACFITSVSPAPAS